MEIRCESCSHVGVARVDLSQGGVRLICANCGHANVLDLGTPLQVVPATTTTAPRPTKRQVAAQLEQESFEDEAFRRLIPEVGNGPRCRKCIHLLEPGVDHCVRCGLNIEESHRYASGEAPWERAPAGREDAWEEADLMWRRVVEDWNEERFSEFAETIRRLDAHDFAARRLRLWLVEHPDDPLALGFLREIAEGLRSRVMIAKAQAQASAAQFSDVTERVRKVLFWVVAVIGVLVLFVIVVGYLR